MDVTDIIPQLDRLDGEIDGLEEVLEPLLGSLPEVASKLPLLDKAKLYVLVTYALESMIFSSLRLNGVDAKEHPVFKELTRVRQYFEKIKAIENPPPPAAPAPGLNREAAIRFIRADLAENDKEVNTKLSEMIAKERAKAALKAARMGAAAAGGVKRKAEGEPEEAKAKEEKKKNAVEGNDEEDDLADEEYDPAKAEQSKSKGSKKSKASKKKRRKSGKGKE